MTWLWNDHGSNGEERTDFITVDLAVGSVVAASDLESLARHGIRAIVDASNREENPRFPGILYQEVPIDDPDERLAEFLPGVVEFLDETRRLGPVLVHCVAGVSRSPALAICYLHERYAFSLPAALDHVRSRRTQADPHPLFLRVILEYYQGRAAGAYWTCGTRKP